jgi:hypothetical protein
VDRDGDDTTGGVSVSGDTLAELRAELKKVDDGVLANEARIAATLQAAGAAVNIGPADLPEIATVLTLLRELVSGDSPDVSDATLGIAWLQLARISLAQSDRTLSDHEVAAQSLQRALRFLRRESNADLWAHAHCALGIAWCEKLRADMDVSFESYRSLLVAARREFDFALEVLRADKEIRALRKWTIDSLDKLNRRRSRPPAT